MATGPQHYQAAEALLESATLGTWPDGSPAIRHEETEHLVAAQVHATLALAAATALSTAPGHEPYDYGEWRDATGTH